LSREPDGLKLQFKKDTVSAKDSIVDSAMPAPKEKDNSWKKDLEEYLEMATDKQIFFREKLTLTDEEIDTLKVSMQFLPQFLCKVTSTSIKIIKYKQTDGNT
jgi:hypothetical protein